MPGSPVMETIAPRSLEEPLEGLTQHRELLLAPDQRRLRASRRSFPDAHDAEGADRAALALQLDAPKLLELERGLDLTRRHRPDHEVAKRLQARRHVDRVAKRVVKDVRRRVPPGNDDRAGVDRHAGRKLDPVGGSDLGPVAGERLAERQRRPYRPLGVVLVRHWGPEER